ncbi:hypothetical protein, partial [Acetobacter sp. AAB5]|uniref:hypothetical protein n=1 Tax=Acetobacter sp. AAB5 TaxID=3418370 RepID=UPI003CF1D8A0
MIKKCLFLFPFFMAFPQQSHAQILTACPTCTQEETEAVRWAQQLASMLDELQRVKSELYADLGEVESLQNIGNGQALTSGNLDGIINRLQSGVYSVGRVSQLNQTLQNNYSVASQQLSTLKNLLSEQQSQLSNDSSNISAMQQAATTTVGTHGAMMVSNELHGQIASQLLKTQQTQMAMAQTLATQAAIENDRQASTDAQAAAMSSDP